MATRRFLLPLLPAVLLAVGCSQVVVPVVPALVDTGEKVPVVLVPGITGTALRDPDSGRLVWGNGLAVLRPHDGGYGLVKPLGAGRQRPGGALELAGVIDAVKLGPIVKEVYGPIVRLLERHGYTAGELGSPRPGDDMFLFAYDWRDENAVSAARLAEALERLRLSRGVDRMPVDLVCQSNGAHVCRWFARFGGATLEKAEAGEAGPTEAVPVRKLVLVSSSNGGSIKNLKWLNRGRSYVSLIGRRWTPEAILPVYRDDLFVDAAGAPLQVDLFDVESWRRYGWSIFSPEVARRIERSGRRDLFGDAAERETFLAGALDRSKRFHERLRRDVAGFDGVSYYMIQNVEVETPLRAMLTPDGDGWRTRFPDDRWLRRRLELRSHMVDPGDGHATVDSQMWLAPQERQALAAEPAVVEGAHFELILAPEAQRSLLAYLSEADPAGRLSAQLR